MNKYKAIKVKGKKIDEHRHIMQLNVGRIMTFNECVHHKNGDKRDNRLSNLEIVDRSEHSRLHRLNGDTGGIPPSWHGGGRYKAGCRCDVCKNAQKMRMRRYRECLKQINK